MTQMPMSDSECDDEIRVTKIRCADDNGRKEAIVQTEEVVELTKTALEVGLFEPPV